MAGVSSMLGPKQAPDVQWDAVRGGSRVVERWARGWAVLRLLGAAGSDDGSGRRQRDVVKT